MDMNDQEESSNVEDVRGSSGGFRPIHGIGIGSVVVAVIAGWVFGINPLQILGLMSGDSGSISQTQPAGPAPSPPPEDAQARFVSKVLRSTETVWSAAFAERFLR